MEHILKRNSGLNATVLNNIRFSKRNGVKTESKIGTPYFPSDENGFLKDVHINDKVWECMEGIIYCTYNIINIHSTFIIEDEKKIWELQNKILFKNYALEYWNNIRDKYYKALEKNKPLYFTIIETSPAKKLKPHEQIKMIDLPKGDERSWFHIANDLDKLKYFQYQGSDILKAMQDTHEYNINQYDVIPTKIKLMVSNIWGDEYWGIRQKINNKEEGLEYDHYVPKSLGGPGIYAENIVPTPCSLNRVKSNIPPIALFEVAMEGKLISPEQYKNIAILTFEDEELITKQQDIARQIISKVRKRTIGEQRHFYFDVLCKGIEKARRFFTKARVFPPNVT